MRKYTSSAALAIAALALTGAACGDGEEDGTVEREVRETATSVAKGAEAATRLTATLTGASEAPTRGDPDGTGTATVNLDVSGGRLCYEVAVQGIDRPVGMHVHEGGAGKSGPIVVRMTTPTSGDGTTNGCADVEGGLMGRIGANPGDFYVNVHTSRYPEGAVRGQLS